MNLLFVASLAIYVSKPEPRYPLKSGQPDRSYLDQILTQFVRERNPETTALLAAVGELLVDDPAAQLRCRREVAERSDHHSPEWIAALPQAEAYRAVRRTHVFGDVDELVIGVRLASGHELTAAVQIDHTLWSSAADGCVVPEPIDKAIAQLAESSSDTEVFEMSLADVRMWIEDALTKPTLGRPTENWPLYQPFVQWLMRRLPEGGKHRPTIDCDSNEDLCDEFFATSAAAPFTESSHRDLLLELFETGHGDPLRWSPARVERAIGRTPWNHASTPLEVLLDAPDLLRAFIPYAHAQSAIRDELTLRTLAKVDALRLSYKREVLRKAEFWDLDDAG